MRKPEVPILVLAGLSGGLAEVLWIASYSAATGIGGLEVARQVTTSVFPAVLNNSLAALLGFVVHFVLSIGLAIAFGWMVWRPLGRKVSRALATLLAIAALSAVWVINFFVVLPALNPAFVTLLPYPVTWISKVLFGGAMAWTVHAAQGRTRRPAARAQPALDAA
jgi:hypothetical protein